MSEPDGYPLDRLIITIDGPAGTGKSSVARDLAARLELEFLDTGAMYRAATALALTENIALTDGRAVSELLRRADLRFEWNDDPPTLLAFGESIMHRLRTAEVAASVSTIAEQPEVRQVLVERQRRIGEQHPRLVSEGRDQGSVVFPEASVKFYLDADASIRAKRRAEQLLASGMDADLEQIEFEIRERDRRDAERKVGPLVCPADAIRINTSSLDQDSVVKQLEDIVRDEAAERLSTTPHAKDRCP